MKVVFACVPFVLLMGCVTGGSYKPVSDKLPGLTVSFADKAWDGKKIPAGQHCQVFGGNGSTPALKVSNIPAGANAIIIEYNDQSYGPLSNGGGHGTIGYRISGTTADLPAVPGHTASVPEGTFIEHASFATGQYASPGYLPPCSGGRGNIYTAVVKAVYKSEKKDENKLLAVQPITLGSY